MQKTIEDLLKLNLIDQDIFDWAFADSSSPNLNTFDEVYKNWQVLQDPVRDIINLQKLRNYATRQHSFTGRPK